MAASACLAGGSPVMLDREVIRATDASETRRPATLRVAGLAAFAAILAAGVRRIVFPHGSINNDEGIYRLQAQTLQHGHLFTPALSPLTAFRPWLAAVVDHHWVLKYVPVEAALLAVAGTVTGTASAALPVIAAAGVAATWLLMRELLDDTASALVATVLVALAPLVIVQSALLVGYLPTLVLLEVFAWSVLRTVRQPRAVWCVLGGVAAGVAGVARPYDTVLFALPLVVLAAVRLGRRLAGPLGWYLIGALPPLAAMVLYDRAATGSAFRLPFNLFEPADRPGFGLRRMYPQEQLHPFGWSLGLRGSADHLLLTVLWVAGGPVLVLLAAIGVWRRRRSGASLAVAATALAFPLGYVFFWGAWNASRLWHGVRYLGPFYFLPMVVAIAAFGGAELVTLYRRWRPLALAVALVGVAGSAIVVAPAVAADARWSRQDGAVLSAVDRVAAASPPAMVLVEPTGYLLAPLSGVTNRWDGSGPLLYGVWNGNTQDLATLDAHHDRRTYLLTLFGTFKPHPAHLAAIVRPIWTKSGPTVTLHVSAPPAAPSPTGLTVELPSVPFACPTTSGDGWDVSIAATGTLACTSRGPSPSVRTAPIAGGGWDGSLRFRASDGATLAVSTRVTAGTVTVIGIGRPLATVGNPPTPQLAAD